MDFMTGLYVSVVLVVLMASAVVWFVAYLADQPGGVLEIGKPRWVMPQAVARAMKLSRGAKLRWTMQPDGSVRVERMS